ncbi:hypothetical protein [Chelativorans sp. J32]|nr:hypothetical protein [Chelativorans sp. J32]
MSRAGTRQAEYIAGAETPCGLHIPAVISTARRTPVISSEKA